MDICIQIKPELALVWLMMCAILSVGTPPSIHYSADLLRCQSYSYMCTSIALDRDAWHILRHIPRFLSWCVKVTYFLPTDSYIHVGIKVTITAIAMRVYIAWNIHISPNNVKALIASLVIFFPLTRAYICAGTKTTLIGRAPSPCSTSQSTLPSMTRRSKQEACTMSPGHTAGTEMGCPCQLLMHHSEKWNRLRRYSPRKRWRGSSQCHQIWRKERQASTIPSWSMAPMLIG